MKRREFITLGGAASWPLVARAQQPAMPVIGLLDPRTPDSNVEGLRSFRQGLKETGYLEGENVSIVYRWAENQFDRLPELAADLVHRQVNAIASIGGQAPVLAAKAVTSSIPIVFIIGEDPVRLGLVASLARPGSNVTGINFLSAELTTKRLELLRQLVPAATRVAVLVNPNGPATEATLRDIEVAARAIGLQVQQINAGNSLEVDAASQALGLARPDALFVASDPILNGRRVQLVHVATYHRLPAAYSGRQFCEIGGLMSYGSNLADAYRQMGVYMGRILKGTKPADLPVLQSSRFELVINHQTARLLGFSVPPSLLATADEVIE
jgi:putative ABC transport system substrate-binding protein